jgi:hypothetical protein
VSWLIFLFLFLLERLGIIMFTNATTYTPLCIFLGSAFYFHAGIFQLPVSGVTHMCGSGLPHPKCTGTAQSEWSAYRFHEMVI